uniref:Uncharacterized protein n=1 Tax=Panagrolaimus davidi TaxID=227884 RepID=A0A914PR66_9BILA
MYANYGKTVISETVRNSGGSRKRKLVMESVTTAKRPSIATSTTLKVVGACDKLVAFAVPSAEFGQRSYVLDLSDAKVRDVVGVYVQDEPVTSTSIGASTSTGSTSAGTGISTAVSTSTGSTSTGTGISTLTPQQRERIARNKEEALRRRAEFLKTHPPSLPVSNASTGSTSSGNTVTSTLTEEQRDRVVGNKFQS